MLKNFPPRTDKWYLGSGYPLMWAPRFPLWLDVPGLWDEASYYNYPLAPLFTLTCLDENGREIPLNFLDRTWQPHALTRRFQDPGRRFTVLEETACLPHDILLSRVTLKNSSPSTITASLVFWTVQETKTTSTLKGSTKGIEFLRTLQNGDRGELDVQCRLSLKTGADSYSIQPSEGTVIHPRWAVTPFFDTWDGQLNNQVRISQPSTDSLIFMGIHRTLTLHPGNSGSETVTFSAAPQQGTQSAVLPPNLTLDQSQKHWDSYFKSLPNFDCSDEFLTRYYWYRWYGLKLVALPGDEGNYPYPTVTEGIGYFRAPISYSAQCHMRETRWMANPDLAQGCLLNFIHNQREEGEFPGYIDLKGDRHEMFYHADWGTPVLETNRIHRDPQFLEKSYDALSRYARVLDRNRDPERSGLISIHNHYETGQEFMSRYTAVSSRADSANWGRRFDLKGVDVTVYQYQIKKALHHMAVQLNRPGEEKETWKKECDFIKASVIDNMWDPEEEMFFDVDPKTGMRTGIKAAICFYPYMTDMVGKEHLEGIRRHLLNPGEFWTPFPAPATSLSDPSFSAEALWKDRRMNCPWNGRVWPMTNSHITECLAQVAVRLDEDFRAITAEFIRSFIGMMFFDKDSTRPNCFEHYNPLTGRPSAYRGIDDYQHSWVVDLILKYVAGVRPGDTSVTVDPFPFGLKTFHLDNLFVRGHRIEIRLEDQSFSVSIGDSPAQESKLGKPLIFAV